MRKILASFLFALILISVLVAQEVIPGRFQRSANELSASAAASFARRFSQSLDLDSGPISQYKLRLEKRPGRNNDRVWNVYTVNARIMVHSISGMVTSYVNAKREDDRYRGRGRTGTKFTNSESVARAHLRSIATQIGIPTSAAMTGYAMKGDGVGQDTSPMGHFGCVFKNAAGEIVATLACDTQDGVVLSYSRSRER